MKPWLSNYSLAIKGARTDYAQIIHDSVCLCRCVNEWLDTNHVQGSAVNLLIAQVSYRLLTRAADWELLTARTGKLGLLQATAFRLRKVIAG